MPSAPRSPLGAIGSTSPVPRANRWARQTCGRSTFNGTVRTLTSRRRVRGKVRNLQRGRRQRVGGATRTTRIHRRVRGLSPNVRLHPLSFDQNVAAAQVHEPFVMAVGLRAGQLLGNCRARPATVSRNNGWHSGPPMTLAKMRQSGVRSLSVTGLDCHHGANVNVMGVRAHSRAARSTAGSPPL
jgi:hypothetical protein